MSNELRERLLQICIRYRAALNGVAPEMMDCKEYAEEKKQLEHMSTAELLKECEWLYCLLHLK